MNQWIMQIPITIELRDVCNQIISKNISLEEWSSIESDDMFQTKSFVGGFDATEKEFTFSYFDDKEYWFQISFDLVSRIAKGETPMLIGKLANA